MGNNILKDIYVYFFGEPKVKTNKKVKLKVPTIKHQQPTINIIKEIVKPSNKKSTPQRDIKLKKGSKDLYDDFINGSSNILNSLKNRINEVSTNSPVESERLEKLIKLGFKKTKEIRDYEDKRHEHYRKTNEINDLKTLLKTINYFKEKYPKYEVLTYDYVKNFLNKNNHLTTNLINDYGGEVKDEYLTYLEAFEVNEVDSTYTKIIDSRHTKLDKIEYLSYGGYKNLHTWNRRVEYEEAKPLFISGDGLGDPIILKVVSKNNIKLFLHKKYDF